MSDLMYDTTGEFIGPKRWDADVCVDDDNNYVMYHMKRDELEYMSYVYLMPAGQPDPAFIASVRPVRPDSYDPWLFGGA
jgi:hypothetical protein